MRQQEYEQVMANSNAFSLAAIKPKKETFGDNMRDLVTNAQQLADLLQVPHTKPSIEEIQAKEPEATPRDNRVYAIKIRVR
jgi:DNA mismatch repair ATPase MutL